MKEQILKLRAEGKTYKEIKEITGCSKGTISYHCGEGQKEKYRFSNQKRKNKNKKWLEEIKSKLVCEKCNEDRWWVLDFHHMNPEEKELNVSKLIKCSNKEKVLKEIKKCQVLCANCHRDLHYKLNNAPVSKLVERESLKNF